MATTVTLSQLSEAFATITVRGLSLEKFKSFCEAVEGARFDRKTRSRLAPIDKVPAILVRLREAGFASTVTSELRTTLQKYTAQQWNDLKAAQERIARMDDAFFKLTGNRLYPFQRTGAQWLATRYGALLADEMGLGKTLQVIAAIPAHVPVIIVAPAVAKGVWRKHFALYRPHLRVSVLSGRDSFRWPEEGEALITNYDILPEVHDKKKGCNGFLPRKKCPGCATEMNTLGFVVRIPGHKKGCDGYLEPERCPGCAPILNLVHPQTALIADEAHALKNGRATRTNRFQALSDAVREHEGRTWELTATPLLNDPKELWTVYRCAGIANEAFGNWKTFVHMFRGKALYWGGYEWGTPEAEVAERIRRVALRRMRAEVLPELPTKTYNEIVVDIKDKKTLKECDKFVKSLGGAAALEEMVSHDKLKFELISSIRASLATAKIPAMMALVEDFEEQGEPLVVFSAHRAPVDLLAKRPGWRVITGDTPADERADIETAFQAGELKGVASTIKAGGVAITLTKAAFSIFVDREWTPALNAQAEDRICRIGQTRGCQIIILVADHILDQRMTELLTRKQKLISASVDASAVRDDVPDKEFEEQIKRIQEEIAGGRAVRRMAESLEEEAALNMLHTLLFPGRDESIALSLAEEADVIGLSNAQWALAIKVAARGIEPGAGVGPQPKRKRKKKSAIEGPEDETPVLETLLEAGGEELDVPVTGALDEDEVVEALLEES